MLTVSGGCDATLTCGIAMSMKPCIGGSFKLLQMTYSLRFLSQQIKKLEFCGVKGEHANVKNHPNKNSFHNWAINTPQMLWEAFALPDLCHNPMR